MTQRGAISLTTVLAVLAIAALLIWILPHIHVN